MSKTTAPPRRDIASVQFRKEIERAEAEGVDRGEMTLRLTLGDVAQLKRDRTLAIADISFADGVMRFLGVRVEEGGVAASTLGRPE